MDSNSVSYKPALPIGVRESYRQSKNEPGLTDLLNGKPVAEGVYPYEAILDPYDLASAVISIEFPEMETIEVPEAGIFLLTSTSVRRVTTTLADWAVGAAVSVVNAYTGASDTIPNSGKPWQIAVFSQSFIACNGSCMIWWDYANTRIRIDKTIYPNAVCSFRGRTVVAGLSRFMANIISYDLFAALGSTNAANASHFGDNWIYYSGVLGRGFDHHYDPSKAIDHLANPFLVPLNEENGFPAADPDLNWTFTGAGWGTATTSGVATIGSINNTSVAKFTITPAMLAGVIDLEVRASITVTSGALTVAFTNTSWKVGYTLCNRNEPELRWFLRPEDVSLPIEVTFTPTAAFNGSIDVFNCAKTIYGKDKNAFNDNAQIEDSGYISTLMPGNVLAVKPMATGIIVYSTDSIIAMIPVRDPIPTFSMRHIASFGIAGPGAVGGGEKVHGFVDSSGQFWMMNTEFAIENRGREELFGAGLSVSGPSACTIKVNYDTREDNFYCTFDVSGALKTVLMTQTGASRIGQPVIALLGIKNVVSSEAQLVGITSSFTDSTFGLTSSPTNLGIEGIKTVRSIKAVIDNTADVYVRMYHRVDTGEAYKISPWVKFDHRGEADFGLPALDFYYEITCTDYSKVRIYDITVLFSVGDKTSFRQFSRKS